MIHQTDGTRHLKHRDSFFNPHRTKKLTTVPISLSFPACGSPEEPMDKQSTSSHLSMKSLMANEFLDGSTDFRELLEDQNLLNNTDEACFVTFNASSNPMLQLLCIQIIMQTGKHAKRSNSSRNEKKLNCCF
jgi:hypothetical protein